MTSLNFRSGTEPILRRLRCGNSRGLWLHCLKKEKSEGTIDLQRSGNGAVTGTSSNPMVAIWPDRF